MPLQEFEMRPFVFENPLFVLLGEAQAVLPGSALIHERMDSKKDSPTSSRTRSSTESDSILVYVVDDESMIGEVVEVILKLKGFKPKFFVDPELALQAITNDDPKPTLLLTDFLMTPINGMELIERAKRIHPELKTILYSGNVGEEIMQYYSVKPDGFVSKPFLPKTLVSVVKTVLDG